MTFIRLGDDRMLNLAQVQRAEIVDTDDADAPMLVRLTLFAFESGREDIEEFVGEEAAMVWQAVERQLSG